VGSKKKWLRADERNRPDVKKRREAWTEVYLPLFMEMLGHLVFIDESGAKTNMTRLYGRAKKGQRCYDDAPHGHWNTTTMVSSIRLDGTTACMTLDGAQTTEAYREYARQILVPELKTGDIVIFDNLRVHHDPKALDLIHAAGAMTLPLPAYSPDLNPIEKMWSKIKALLRKAKARTLEALEAAIKNALEAVTGNDAIGWFKSCGYAQSQP
jgi:transposase